MHDDTSVLKKSDFLSGSECNAHSESKKCLGLFLNSNLEHWLSFGVFLFCSSFTAWYSTEDASMY